jgi:hypothetical protein
MRAERLGSREKSYVHPGHLMFPKLNIAGTYSCISRFVLLAVKDGYDGCGRYFCSAFCEHTCFRYSHTERKDITCRRICVYGTIKNILEPIWAYWNSTCMIIVMRQKDDRKTS